MFAMFSDFQYRHIPVLYLGTALGFGGMMPFFGYSRQALIGYGFPPRIADRPEAWPVIRAGWARMSCIGFFFLTFYYQKKYDVLDTLLGITAGYLAVADTYTLWCEGVRGYALFRLSASALLSALGFAGLTQGHLSA